MTRRVGRDMIRGPTRSAHLAQVSMLTNAIYTDLSGYYDLLCADIDYQAQSQCVQRLHQLFGNGGRTHLDLACGTGPHVRHFLDAGYGCSGLDINQPMLDRAIARCPEAAFSLQDMCSFSLDQPVDLITCFLYSIHYSATLERLQNCLASAHRALAEGGLFCFNAVDKHQIDNHSYVTHTVNDGDGSISFSSGWHYSGEGEQQALRLRVERASGDTRQVWSDSHTMVAVGLAELTELLAPLFEVHAFEHDYQAIRAWDGTSGNILLACVKI